MSTRQFNVVVLRQGKPALEYPDSEGMKALQCMRTLAKRGYACVAFTQANGIAEQLTLSEMTAIYGTTIR